MHYMIWFWSLMAVCISCLIINNTYISYAAIPILLYMFAQFIHYGGHPNGPGIIESYKQYKKQY